jgi:hypothetical protein
VFTKEEKTAVSSLLCTPQSDKINAGRQAQWMPKEVQSTTVGTAMTLETISIEEMIAPASALCNMLTPALVQSSSLGSSRFDSSIHSFILFLLKVGDE